MKTIDVRDTEETVTIIEFCDNGCYFDGITSTAVDLNIGHDSDDETFVTLTEADLHNLILAAKQAIILINA